MTVAQPDAVAVAFHATSSDEMHHPHVLGRVGLSGTLDRLPLAPSTPGVERSRRFRLKLRLRLLPTHALIHERALTVIDRAVDRVHAEVHDQAGEIPREWPGSVIVASKDPRPIVPGSKVWCLDQ